VVLLGWVDGCELLSEVGEVGEGEFAWIGFVTNAEEADVVLDGVAIKTVSKSSVTGL
jgi:hypothetical protein